MRAWLLEFAAKNAFWFDPENAKMIERILKYLVLPALNAVL